MLSAPVALLGFIVFRARYTSESNKGLNLKSLDGDGFIVAVLGEVDLPTM